VEDKADKRRCSPTTASFSNAGTHVKVRALKAEGPCAAAIISANFENPASCRVFFAVPTSPLVKPCEAGSLELFSAVRIQCDNGYDRRGSF